MGHEMTAIHEPRFSFSPSAIKAIAALRPLFEAQLNEKSGAVFVAWGTSLPQSGSLGASALIISFYTEHQMIEMAKHVRIIDGLEVILFTLPENYPRFEGKVIDYTNDKGFILRQK